MSNSMGLLLIFFGIAILIGLVVLVMYFEKKHPDTKIGQISKKISRLIDTLPDD